MELRESRNLIPLEARSKNLTNFAQPSASFSAPPDGIFADPKRAIFGTVGEQEGERLIAGAVFSRLGGVFYFCSASSRLVPTHFALRLP